MLSDTMAYRGTLFLAAALLLLFLVLGVYVHTVDHAVWEVRVIRSLQDSGVPGLRPVSIALAIVGTGLAWTVLVGAIGLVILLASGLRAALLLLLAALLQDVGAAIKLVVERARPTEQSVEVWRQVSSYSFPSGHTLGATLVFGFLIIAIERTALDVRLKRALQGGCLAWIALMGISRIELGAHWPTDVLAAYLVGALLLIPMAALLGRSAARVVPSARPRD
jgi:membrane-associated phospholipid phosphatase